MSGMQFIYRVSRGIRHPLTMSGKLMRTFDQITVNARTYPPPWGAVIVFWAEVLIAPIALIILLIGSFTESMVDKIRQQ